LKKKDIIFLAAIIALMAGAVLTFQIINDKKGHEVVIEEGGEIVGIYPLSEDRIIEVTGPLGISTVVIKDGEVYMADSPCPNKVCIHMGKKSKKDDTIICIPNRIYITVK
jgi:hypothetical protein